MTRPRRRHAAAIAAVFFSICSSVLWAAEGGPGEIIIHHLQNSNTWKPLPYLPGIPLPGVQIGSFYFGLSVHAVCMWVSAGFLIALFVPAFRRATIAPRGAAAILESVVLFVRDDMVYPSMGEELGKKWLPFFTTVFLFLLTTNLLGLIPAFGTATSNMSVTAGMAGMILFLIFAGGMKSLGPIGFIKNMIPENTPWPIAYLVLVLELGGFFIKSFALCLRLFANMLAGHIVILALLILIFLLHPVAALLSVPFALFINFLEILVALIQALVFTLLSCVFVGMACHHH